MIDRYSRKEIRKIWNEKNKYQIWLDIEIAAAEAMEKIKAIPKGVSFKIKRKAKIDERSDAFIVLPGGIGTLEEAIEILSMRQLKLTDKPLVFVNSKGFFETLNKILDIMIEQKFAKENLRNLFAMTPDPKTALKYILNYKT